MHTFCIVVDFNQMLRTDAAGAASYALDFPTLPVAIANGATWNFQFWLRDVGGSGFNFSDGLEITFCP